MAKVLTGLIVLILVVYGLAMAIPLDPEEQRPGLKLSGELAEDQVGDWSSYGGPNKIWVQTNTWYGVPHSVTTISFATNGAFYVPCRDCDTKRWPRNVARDPRVRLKINGELYDRTAVRITDAAELSQVQAVLGGMMGGGSAEGIAVFRMDPR